MVIELHFINGTPEWQKRVQANAEIAQRRLSSPELLKKVAYWEGFDFTRDEPKTVAMRLVQTEHIHIRVGFYSKWWTRAIAYEDDGVIYFNTRKARNGAGSPGNIAHEVMHVMGYSHNGNSPRGQTNTVPYRIGQWVDEMTEMA